MMQREYDPPAPVPIWKTGSIEDGILASTTTYRRLAEKTLICPRETLANHSKGSP